MTTTNSVKRYKMSKLIASLSSKEGTAKDFVSIYIPRQKTIQDVDIILKEKLDSLEISILKIRENMFEQRFRK